MSKRKAKTRPNQRVEEGVVLDMSGLMLCVASMLLVWRALVPAESAPEGETLWIALCWLVLGTVWCWSRLGRSVAGCWDRLDLAVGLLAGGQVLSALVVLASEGQKRAALNMLWEWVGLAVSFFLLRRLFNSPERKRGLILSLVALAVVVAGYGLWQHYVSLPALAADLTEFQELEAERAAGGADVDRVRYDELRRQFATLPPEGPDRIRFVQRLRDSSEPFGMFALANTFGGWLVVWIILAAAWWSSGWSGASLSRRLVSLLPLLLLLFCLILTKSRTAVVAFGTGIVIWGGLQSGRLGRRGWWAVGGGAGAMAILLAIAAASGGFDRQVLSEAPKSLRYRIEYWTATWDIIAENPWFGTGPGNFAQEYQRLKLPEASEDIVDPHNLVFDVWANAGPISLVGLLMLLVLIARSVWAKHEGESLGVAGAIPVPVLVGGALGFAVPFISAFVFEARLNGLLLILGLSWYALLIGLSRRRVDDGRLNQAALIAAVALCIHLTGAGGIAMPAICQTLLLLAAITHPVRETDRADVQPRGAVVGLGLSVIVVIGCLLTAAFPVTKRELLTTIAAGASSPRGRESSLLDAAAADPFSPMPARQLAELAFRSWETNPLATEAAFEDAVKRLQVVVALNPRSYRPRRQLGNWYLARYRRTRSSADAELAADAFQAAWERYPTHPALCAELADAQALCGRSGEAGRMAARALELDQINRRAGHVDRVLPEKVTSRLNALTRSAEES